MESGTEVVGREEEVAALTEFLDARTRLPAVLLLEGEAGIGKTTLWRRGVELAAERGYRLLSCKGSSSEAQLSFVALGDLLRQTAVGGITVAASVAAIGLATTPANADMVYHSEHLGLAPVGGAPLRSGFVQNIKAEGPVVYAHEIFVLNGARPRSTYAVTRNFFPFDSDCSGDNGVFASHVATLTTNRSGNAKGDVFVRPEEVAGFEGVHGVKWTVHTAAGALAYQTTCTAVTLD